MGDALECHRRRLAAVQGELAAKTGRSPHTLAPYMCTPKEIVDQVMELAAVGPGDVVFDIGCGDGCLLCAAAARGATGRGWDIDPVAIADAVELMAKTGSAESVRVVCENVLDPDLVVPWAEATVVVLYMGVAGNLRLRPILLRT
jgi:predicted RNA methylase